MLSFSGNFLFSRPFNHAAAVLGFICARAELTIIKSSIDVILKKFFITGCLV